MSGRTITVTVHPEADVLESETKPIRQAFERPDSSAGSVYRTGRFGIDEHRAVLDRSGNLFGGG